MRIVESAIAAAKVTALAGIVATVGGVTGVGTMMLMGAFEAPMMPTVLAGITAATFTVLFCVEFWARR